MCGRFGFDMPPKRAAAAFGLAEEPQYAPGLNYAPGAYVLAILPTQEGSRIGRSLRWGLVPHWAKDPQTDYKMFNARAETVAEKPSFRTAFKRRRCLIPATRFYEWKKEGKNKEPYAIGLADETPFAMAGLWESWQGPEEIGLYTCTIITTSANELIAPLHDRMPVILTPEACVRWLNPTLSATALQQLLRPHAPQTMRLWPADPKQEERTRQATAQQDI